MKTALTIGNFDGVHRGHRALVARCRESADAVSAIFFDPHPAAYFGRARSLLTSASRRAHLLRDAGVDRVDIRAFDANFAEQSPEAFVRDIILGDHGADTIVIGPDFRFGKGAKGTALTLRELGQELGFSVVVADAVSHKDEIISSTRIRKNLACGDVESAAELLGRFHVISGRVVQGDKRGRTIGFPTANLGGVVEVLPGHGVYAVAARVLGHIVFGMANVGTRPTFEAGLSVETHLFDFSKDIYDEDVSIAFLARIRDEQRFDSVEALVAQLHNDAKICRRITNASGDLTTTYAAYQEDLA